jgi:hypothetical protein
VTKGEARPSDDGWQPATSRPGELYTYEGQIRSFGHFFRALRRKGPENDHYVRPMVRMGLFFVAIALVVVAVAVLVQAVF